MKLKDLVPCAAVDVSTWGETGVGLSKLANLLTVACKLYILQSLLQVIVLVYYYILPSFATPSPPSLLYVTVHTLILNA